MEILQLPPFSRACAAVALVLYLGAAWFRATEATTFALLSAFLGWWATTRLIGCCELWFQDVRLRRAAVLATAFAWFLPWGWARYSSDSWSAAFFLLGFTTLIKLLQEKREPRWAELFTAGLLMGLAVAVHYRVAILVVFALAWLARFGPRRSVTLGGTLCGFVVGLVPALAVGHTGAFPAGSVPFFGTGLGYSAGPFLEQFVVNKFAPLGILLFAGALLGWARKPRLSLTWITLPFVVFHFFVGPAEPRLFFPVLPVLPALGLLGLQSFPRVVEAIFYRPIGQIVVALVGGLNGLALVLAVAY